MEFNLADLWERVVDAVPDHEAMVCADRRLTYARGRRPRQPPRPPPRGPRHRCGRPRGALPLQRHRVPRRHARRVQAARGADQRELPLRRGRAAVPPRRRRRQGRGLPPRVLAHGSQRCARRCRCSPASSWSTTIPRAAIPHDAADYEDALAAASAARDFPPRSADDLYILYTGGTTGMPKGVMWRAEDIFFGAFGGGNLGDAPITQTRADRRLARPPPPRSAGVPVHARHRALDGVRDALFGRHRRGLARPPPRFRTSVAAGRARAGHVPRHRGRCVRPSADRGARPARPAPRRRRAHRGAVGRCGALALGEGRVGRAAARHAAHRRLRRVGDGRPGAERVGRRRPHRDRAPVPGERRDDGARRRPPPRAARRDRQAGTPGPRPARVLPAIPRSRPPPSR